MKRKEDSHKEDHNIGEQRKECHEGNGVKIEVDTSDEEGESRQCVLSSPVITLGSCLLNMATLFFCKMGIHQ